MVAAPITAEGLLSVATDVMLNLLERPAAPITPTGRWLVRPLVAAAEVVTFTATGEAVLLCGPPSEESSVVALGRILRGGVLVRSLPVLESRRPLGPFRLAATAIVVTEFLRDDS